MCLPKLFNGPAIKLISDGIFTRIAFHCRSLNLSFKKGSYLQGRVIIKPFHNGNFLAYIYQLCLFADVKYIALSSVIDKFSVKLSICFNIGGKHSNMLGISYTIIHTISNTSCLVK